ncbi:hypothetical protein SCP_0308460 [Sparassis crispa]|uniref:Uncharacterized protein n=1 Tax=Sparassis crispa TaxID=139825 RepID=A0A401GG14_9APHY|nr:hypothetical protein SCP_0308460 [Sparassis crispa]GBE81120.1 hypothetical protein SCP_0308460 [Sparassis crispa]
MSETTVQPVSRPRKRRLPRAYGYAFNWAILAPLARELDFPDVTLSNLVNTYFRFRFYLMNTWDVPNECFRNLSTKGNLTVGVVFADNCSRKRKKPDEDLVQRVKKAMKMEEDPKWYYLV